MASMVVIWNYAAYERILPGGITLKPGKNTVPADKWEELKQNPRVQSLLALGESGGIAEKDLNIEISERLAQGEPISIVNDYPLESIIAWIYAESDPARLQDYQGVAKPSPQIQIALTKRLGELQRSGGRKRTRERPSY